jgi:hypothetical protein
MFLSNLDLAPIQPSSLLLGIKLLPDSVLLHRGEVLVFKVYIQC